MNAGAPSPPVVAAAPPRAADVVPADATVSDLLARARHAGVERLDAALLLGHRLGVTRAWLIAHDDASVAAPAAEGFAADLARRAAGVPLAYLVGSREFHGLALRVSPAVLVPRPDTEVLVDEALRWLAAHHPPPAAPEVLDLGTGSGAVALAVSRGCPHARVTAVDLSAQALAVARDNGRSLGLTVSWLEGDWFTPVAGRCFDLVLSNPPYIDADDPHLAALHAEPRLALSPGPDGLAAIDRIVTEAAGHLWPGGALLLEHGHTQGLAVRERLARAGFADIRTWRDLAGHERGSGGHRPAGVGARAGLAGSPRPPQARGDGVC